MNVERMLKLADAIEAAQEPIDFNMIGFCTSRIMIGDPIPVDECGTACCIGGWACYLFGEKGAYYSEQEGRKVLDLNLDQVENLFYNEKNYISKGEFGSITRKQAARAIRRMASEG